MRESRGVFARLAVFALRVPVRIYRYMLSPLLGPRCRYYPTCSAYMDEALRRHGAGRGLLLGLARILSCHPWGRRPFDDPVPERFDWRDLFRYKQGMDLPRGDLPPAPKKDERA